LGIPRYNCIHINIKTVFGAFVASLEEKPESSLSAKVIQATQIAPSLWPILFSGVLGNIIRVIADWRAESGIPLMVQTQLWLAPKR
jgi:hypothetical protein